MDPTYDRRDSIANTNKSKWDRLWPVIACGAGLFSDGYLNGVGGARPERQFSFANIFFLGHWLSQHNAQDYL